MRVGRGDGEAEMRRREGLFEGRVTSEMNAFCLVKEEGRRWRCDSEG